MSETLQEPEAYVTRLAAMQARRAPNLHPLRLSLERKQHRHPECDGRPWGWYEVNPLGVVVGYWGSYRDDLQHVDLTDWNRRAAAAPLNQGDEP